MSRYVPKMTTKTLSTIALLIAMEVILTRFLSIQTPIVRIGLGFVPIAAIGMLYGPLYAGLAMVMSDIIGVALFPTGVFFPGFTLSAFLTGAVFGMLFYNMPANTAAVLFRICCAAVVVCILIQLGLDTLRLQIITGKGYLALFPARVLKTALMIPVQIMLIYALKTQVLNRLNLRSV